jgi:hypothetical protein
MTIKDILNKNLLLEMMVPVNISYKKWKQMRNEGMTPKKYNEKNPEAKWRIVHCHKAGHIGETLKGSSEKSYQEILKMHRALKR